MLAARLIKMSSYFERSVNFLPRTKILTSKNLVILNRALCRGVNEDQDKKIIKQNYLVVQTFYQQYLLSNSNYVNFIFPHYIKPNSRTAMILNQLDQKENAPDVKNLKYFSDYLDQELNQFLFNELCELVFLIVEYLKRNGADPSWDKILQSINEQCLTRLSCWTVDELIIMLNISLELSQFTKFRNKLFYKLIKKCSRSHEIVILFYFFIRRKLSVPKEYLFPLHLKILKILPEISSIEAAIIAEGFYKSFESLQTSDVLFYVLKKAKDDVENIEEIPFQSFCKFSRVMSNILRHEGVPEFQKNFIKTALKFGIQNVVYLARSGENARYLDSDLRSVLMKEIKDRMSQLSIFHIERVAYLTTIFNIHDEEFLKLALNAFKIEKFTGENKKLFLLFLKHLICYKMYPKNLLDFVLGDEFFVNPKALRTQLSPVWWFIHCSLEVEQPEYMTFDLTPKHRNILFQVNKSLHDYKNPNHYLLLQKIRSVLAKHYKEENVKLFMPLPHYPPGLLMRFDKNFKSQMLPEEFQALRKSHIIKPLKDDHIWLFITLVQNFHLADPSASLLNFSFQTQLRQLNATGYAVLPVLRKSFRHFSLYDPQAEEYLVNLINAKLEECCKDQKCTVTN